MKVGPKPSRAVVDAGAVTQFWVKKLSPTANVRISAVVRLAAGSPKEFRFVLDTVVSPPSNSFSNSSGA